MSVVHCSIFCHICSDLSLLLLCFACSDLSLWAFEKLADTKLGVIAVEWRDVPCGNKPNKPAKNPWGQRSGPDRSPPGGWNPAMDKRVRGDHFHGKGKRLLGVNPTNTPVSN